MNLKDCKLNVARQIIVGFQAMCFSHKSKVKLDFSGIICGCRLSLRKSVRVKMKDLWAKEICRESTHFVSSIFQNEFMFRTSKCP